jgi:hypothetical protein
VQKIKIQPAQGLKVRDPKTKQHLPASGAEVEKSSYWIRRLSVGDVHLMKETASNAVAEEKKTTKKSEK